MLSFMARAPAQSGTLWRLSYVGARMASCVRFLFLHVLLRCCASVPLLRFMHRAPAQRGTGWRLSYVGARMASCARFLLLHVRLSLH